MSQNTFIPKPIDTNNQSSPTVLPNNNDLSQQTNNDINDLSNASSFKNVAFNQTKPIAKQSESDVVTKEYLNSDTSITDNSTNFINFFPNGTSYYDKNLVDKDTKASEQLDFLKHQVIKNATLSNTFYTEIHNNDVGAYMFDLHPIFNTQEQYNLKSFFNKGQTIFPIFSKQNIDLLAAKKQPKATKKNQEVLKPFKDVDKISRTLNNIKSQSNAISSDTGKQSIYIGWPFISGSIEDIKQKAQQTKLPTLNTKVVKKPTDDYENDEFKLANNVFYAPLLLWTVDIEFDSKKNPILILKHQNGNPEVQINDEILKHLLLDNNKKSLKSPVLHYHPNPQTFAKNIATILNQHDINLTTEQINQITSILKEFKTSKFENINRLDYVKTPATKIYNKIVIGSFSSNDSSIFYEYDKLQNPSGYDWLNKQKYWAYDALKTFKDAAIPFKEQNLKEVVALDYAQKKATNVALEDSLVIQGPPGCGKSQVISNIIANLIYRLKSVLFVAEKKGAADVVFNRLNRLRLYTLMLYETPSLKKDFTNQIKNTLNHIGQMITNFEDLLDNRNFEDLSQSELDEIFAKVNEFKKVMISKQGREYPDFITTYQDKKQELLKSAGLISNILAKSNNTRDFWKNVSDAKDEYESFLRINNQLINEENLIQETDLFYLFNTASSFDGSIEFYNWYLPLAITQQDASLYPDPSEQLPDELTQNENVLRITNIYEQLSSDDINIFHKYSLEWFQLMKDKIKTNSYEKNIKFFNNYDYENFDFKLVKSISPMMRFGNENSSSLALDKEDYFKNIQQIIQEKLRNDSDDCEFNLIKLIITTLFTNRNLYNQFNRLYNYICGIELVSSIDEVVKVYGDVLGLIYPVFIFSPSLVAKLIKCEPALFDKCIFDEASQITIEKAIPIMYRAKSHIIVGDSKQLPPPNSYFNNLQQQALLQQHLTSVNKIDAMTLQDSLLKGSISLLSYFESKYRICSLNYHYRSEKRELIEFSNQAFYDGKINVASLPTYSENGLKTYNLKGVCKNKINDIEAQEAIAIVESICKQPDHESIGIITFSKEQKDYIENLIRNHQSKAIANELDRVNDNGEDESLFVRSIDEVQGAERSNIIISFGFSSNNPTETPIESLGIIASAIGQKYLNVMISRSKKNMFILKSFNSSYIPNNISDSVSVFKSFIRYIEEFEKVGDLNHPSVEAILIPFKKSSSNFDYTVNKTNIGSTKLLDSFLSAITPHIDTDLYEIKTNHFEGSSCIDVVFINNQTQTKDVGVVIDAYKNDFTKSPKERDFYELNYLTTRGWKIYKLSKLAWSKQNQQAKIMQSFFKFAPELKKPEVIDDTTNQDSTIPELIASQVTNPQQTMTLEQVQQLLLSQQQQKVVAKPKVVKPLVKPKPKAVLSPAQKRKLLLSKKRR